MTAAARETHRIHSGRSSLPPISAADVVLLGLSMSVAGSEAAATTVTVAEALLDAVFTTGLNPAAAAGDVSSSWATTVTTLHVRR